jgi:hypothetical protein
MGGPEADYEFDKRMCLLGAAGLQEELSTYMYD